ncbi:MAG TPA: glycosyltransferase family 9 protein [Patescibacteria group bacterium]|nr:glycosyltransferase family 9 protein [Patescibacteria group bacterium]
MFNQLRRLDCLLGKLLCLPFFLSGAGSGKKTPSFPEGVKKIACIKLWGLGNLAIIYPLLYRIKERFPGAQLIFITFAHNKGFLERNQAVDRVIYFECTSNIVAIARQFFRLLAALKQEGVDLVVNFETFNNISAFFSYLTRASGRIGLYTAKEKAFYNYPSYNEQALHISRLFLGLLKPLGINSEYKYFRYHGSEGEAQNVESLLRSLGIKKFICLHPGTSSNFKGKRYRAGNFAKLTELFMGAYGIPVLFTGAENESALIEDIIRRLPRSGSVVNLAGKLTLWELVELLKKTRLFISSDTGPVHIAASLGVNLAVFYGPTSPRRYGPLNENSRVFYKHMGCSPCVGAAYVHKRCRNGFACLDFSPQEAFAGISEKFFHAEKN